VTLYIILSSSPDIVTRYDNVVCLNKYDNGDVTIRFVNDIGGLTDKFFDDVISIESN